MGAVHIIGNYNLDCAESRPSITPQEMLEKAMALFILALGAFSRQDQYFGDEPANFDGLGYFFAACDLEEKGSRSKSCGILAIQCKILKW